MTVHDFRILPDVFEVFLMKIIVTAQGKKLLSPMTYATCNDTLIREENNFFDVRTS